MNRKQNTAKKGPASRYNEKEVMNIHLLTPKPTIEK